MGSVNLSKGDFAYFDLVPNATYIFSLSDLSYFGLAFYDGDNIVNLSDVDYSLDVPVSSSSSFQLYLSADSFKLKCSEPRLRLYLVNISDNPVSIDVSYTSNEEQVNFITTVTEPMISTANLSNLGGVLLTSLNFVLPIVAGYFAFRYIFNKVRKRFKGVRI